jgi:hypothetical protein
MKPWKEPCIIAKQAKSERLYESYPIVKWKYYYLSAGKESRNRWNTCLNENNYIQIAIVN